MIPDESQQGTSPPFPEAFSAMPPDADTTVQGMESSNKASDSIEPAAVSLITLPKKPPLQEDLEPERSQQTSRHRSPDQIEKARRRQEAFLQTRREKKKRRVFYQRIRMLLRLVFTVVLAVGWYFFITAPFWQFLPEQVRLHGVQLITMEHLGRFLQPYKGQAIYRIHPKQLSQAIRRDMPLVDQVVVRRHLFPVRLDISITEKPIWGVLYQESPVPWVQPSAVSTNASIQDTPAPTSAVSPPKPAFLLHWDNTITDLAPYQLMPEELAHKQAIPLVSIKPDISSALLAQYRPMAQFLNSQPQQARLLYLDISNPIDIRAYFEGFCVRIGRADQSAMARLAPLFQLVPNIRQYAPTLQYVDLRWHHQILFKKKPVVSGFQMQPDEQPSPPANASQKGRQ